MPGIPETIATAMLALAAPHGGPLPSFHLQPTDGCVVVLQNPNPLNIADAMAKIMVNGQVDPVVYAQFQKEYPASYVRLGTGIDYYYKFLKSRARRPKGVLLLFGGIGYSVLRELQNEQHLQSRLEHYHVVYVELLGQGATWMSQIITQNGVPPRRNSIRDQKIAFVEGIPLIREQIKSIEKVDIGEHFALEALSWGGWVAAGFAADPTVNHMIHSLSLTDPGLGSIGEWLYPQGRAYQNFQKSVEDATHLVQQMMFGMWTFSSSKTAAQQRRETVERREQDERDALRAYLETTFRAFHGDPYALQGAVANVDGMRDDQGVSINVTNIIPAIPTRIALDIHISENGHIIHPRMYIEAIEANARRLGINAEGLTTVLQKDTVHDTFAVRKLGYQRATARLITDANNLGPVVLEARPTQPDQWEVTRIDRVQLFQILTGMIPEWEAHNQTLLKDPQAYLRKAHDFHPATGLEETVRDMAQKNSASYRVLAHISRAPDGAQLLRNLSQLNINASELWILYRALGCDYDSIVDVVRNMR